MAHTVHTTVYTGEAQRSSSATISGLHHWETGLVTQQGNFLTTIAEQPVLQVTLCREDRSKDTGPGIRDQQTHPLGIDGRISASSLLVGENAMIKVPIFLDESGDVLVFESVQYAERYIEPIDVIKNRCIGYDSEGRLLHFTVTDKKQVSIRSDESEPKHLADLQRMLVRFLTRLGESENWLSNASLQDLIAKMMKHKIS